MGFPHRVQQASWTSPMTNRLLLEAGFGTYLSWYGGKEREGNNRDLIHVTEQAGIIPELQLPLAGLVETLQQDADVACVASRTSPARTA